MVNNEFTQNHESDNDLELSQEHLKMLYVELAQTLTLHGGYETNKETTEFKKAGDKGSYVFEYDIPLSEARKLFLSGNDDVVLQEADVKYLEPRRIDQPSEDQLVGSVSVTLVGRDAISNLDVIYHWRIDDIDGKMITDVTEDDTERELTVFDAEKLLKINDFIKTHPELSRR